MLSTVERRFLTLYLKCSQDGDFDKLMREGFDLNYQNVIWHRISKKHNPLSKDNSLIKKALEARKVFS